jgi:selenocysteine-specific translation elongation factor
VEEIAMAEQKIGVVIHYWTHIQVAGIHMTDGELQVGDTIHVKGHTSDFTQRIGSMQVDNQAVETARAGEDIGVKVADYAREHDEVFRVTED